MLRRHRRQAKSATLDDIERFRDDVTRATVKVAACERTHDRLSDEVAQGDAWHANHDWRRERLTAIQAELKGLGHIDLRRIPLPERSPAWQRDLSRTTGLHSRLAEIVRPPLPGNDAALGMDLGL